MENQPPPSWKRRGIPTARRGLKGPLCPKHAVNSSQRLNWPRRRPRPNISDDEEDARAFPYLEESLDETDRSTTTFSSIWSDEGSPETLYKGLCTQCELSGRPSRIYPDLEPLRTPVVDPLMDLPGEEVPPVSEKLPRFRHGPTPLILIAMVLLLITSIMVLGQLFGRGLQAQEQEGGLSLPEHIHAKIRSGLKGLRSQTQQEKHFWIQVLAQLTLLSEESPDQPAVLLGLATSDAQGAATASCLSQQIANVVSAAFDDSSASMFDTRSILFGVSSAPAFKLELDRALQTLNSSHAIAVHNLERIPPTAAMLLHAYCDTENAPFKRALIILTVEVDREYSSLADTNLDLAAYNRLMELWSSLREEDASAIASRVAKAPVLFRPETTSIIHRLCPH